MQIPVLVEFLAENQYRAEAPAPFSVSAEGSSSEEAVRNLRARIEEEFSNGRTIVFVDVSMSTEPKWMKYAGHLKDDPLFEKWQAEIHEYRRQRDIDDGIETDERA
jgi:predicted RNase H-like HicB family nuclease